MLSYRCNATPASYPGITIRTVIFLLILFQATIATSGEILIGTDQPGSFSYFAGKAICQSIERQDGELSCRPVPGGTATDNLTNLGNGSIDLALVSSRTIYDAIHQSGPFTYINIDYNGLRLLMPIYRSPVALVARKNSGICCLDDLQGKRVNCGSPNSQELMVFRELQARKNWQDASFSLLQKIPASMSQDSLALRNGSVQAMLHVGMHPNKRVEKILLEDSGALIPLEDEDIEELIADRVGFCKCTIPAKSYTGLNEDLTTLAVETLLVGSSDTDNSTIELVLAALHSGREQLQHAHPALLKMKTTVSVLNDSYLHPHPSALLFFQATGGLY